MNIRRNKDGNMLYVDARELLETAVTHGLVSQVTIDGIVCVVVYISGGEMPDGMYPVPKEETIQSLMRDDEGIKAIYDALKEKGVEFKPSCKIHIAEGGTWL